MAAVHSSASQQVRRLDSASERPATSLLLTDSCAPHVSVKLRTALTSLSEHYQLLNYVLLNIYLSDY